MGEWDRRVVCSEIYQFMIKVFKYNISKSSKIVFMGSDSFAYHPLVALHSHFNRLDVVTHHTRPGIKAENRVSQYCKKVGIPYSTPIHKTSKEQRTAQWTQYENSIKDQKYDLGVVCSYGFMIPSRIIKHFKEGIIVVHPSLLPKYRGGAPIFHTIANGDEESGISFIEISRKKFDAGNILYQTKISIPADKDYAEIEELLSLNAADKLPYVIQNLQQLRPGIPQPQQEVSGAPIVTQKFLDLKLPSDRVYNLSRAIKGARVKLEDKELIVKLKQQYSQLPENYEPGTVFKKGRKGAFITCGDGKAVRLSEFMQPSKVFIPATAFLNKYLRDQPTVKLN